MKVRDQRAARVDMRQGSARTAGLILAAVILVVFAVVVMFFVVKAPGPKREPQVAEGPSVTPDPSLVPAAKASTATSANRLGGGQGFYLQMVDKDDPSRVRGELSAVRSQPVEGQTYRVALEKPVIWAFLKDGRTVYARGDTGTAYLPDQAKGTPSRPQDGVLRGDVIVKVFEAREKGLRPDPERDEPLIFANTSELKFDAELGQFEAPNPFYIRGWMGEMQGTGMTVLYNDVLQRLELLHIARTEYARFRPGAKSPEKKKTPPAKPGVPVVKPSEQVAGAKPGANGAGSGAVAKAPVETVYRTFLTNKVVVTQGTRSISADALEVWARLIDNELRPGAVVTSNMEPVAGTPEKKDGQGSVAAAPAPKTPDPAAGGATKSAGDQRTASPLAAASDEPVELRWTGPMEIRPVTSGKVDELAFNDVFVRFTAQADDGLKVADEKARARGHGKVLEYGATRREVALMGPEGGEAMIGSEEAGDAFGPGFELDLVRGIAHIPGKGRLVGAASKKEGEQGRTRSLAWSREAEFQFKLDDRKEMTEVLTKVKADGQAKATDGDGSVAGEVIIAELVPVGDQKSRLDKLNVVGTTHATDGKGGELNSDTLEVAFVPTPGKPEESDPSVVLAKGHVVGVRDNGELNTEWLQAKIARVGEKNQLDATSLEARDITYKDANGVTAKAPLLTADPIARSARLQGPAGTALVSKNGSVIVGDDMTFLEKERRLVVNGAGKLTHVAAAKESSEPTSEVLATWTKRMAFDDVTGVVECEGEADALVTKTLAGVLAERDTMKAEKVELLLAPAKKVAAGEEKDELGTQGRELLRAELSGSKLSRTDGELAKVEARRYATGARGQQGPLLERLLYLEGGRINLDEQKATLRVPGEGRLVVLDQRAADEVVAKNTNPLDPAAGGGRGRSMFTWTGAMNLERAQGVVTMEDNVELRHRRPGDESLTELDCEKLTATFREKADRKPLRANEEPEFGGELVSAKAEGAVWIGYNGRQMVADIANYDALKRILDAKASGPNLVQVFDPKSASPITAKELRWDLVKDRIDITKPGTVVGPR